MLFEKLLTAIKDIKLPGYWKKQYFEMKAQRDESLKILEEKTAEKLANCGTRRCPLFMFEADKMIEKLKKELEEANTNND